MGDKAPLRPHHPGTLRFLLKASDIIELVYDYPSLRYFIKHLEVNGLFDSLLVAPEDMTSHECEFRELVAD